MIDLQLQAEVEGFVHREARLADEFRLDEWESLLTDDFHYWVPAGRLVGDPAAQLSYINDNRARVATRIRQLNTGKRLAQLPQSPMRRLVANIEVLGPDDVGEMAWPPLTDDELVIGANFVIYEVAAQSSGELRVWPGHVRYRLRRVDGDLQMAAKWVELVTAELGQRNLTFLI